MMTEVKQAGDEKEQFAVRTSNFGFCDAACEPMESHRTTMVL